MTKRQSDGDWDASKGRAAIYLAIRAAVIAQGGYKAWTRQAAADALREAMNADQNDNGLVEYGYRQKSEKEISGAIQRQGYSGDALNAAWESYNDFYGKK